MVTFYLASGITLLKGSTTGSTHLAKLVTVHLGLKEATKRGLVYSIKILVSTFKMQNKIHIKYLTLYVLS